MGVTWTKEQKQVIELRGRNILVSAAAGSGKTAVLVERIITMLTKDADPVSVDQLLIVTFTEAAAAEMKERIRTAIERKLEEYPENEHLKQQATLIHNAQITTIHSFCLSVIRDHFHTIDLDPGFRIGEEGELKLLWQDVLDALLEEQYRLARPEFLDFVSAYGGTRNDKRLNDLILKIYEFSRGYPDSEGWLRDCMSAYQAETAEELEKSAYVRLIMENTGRCLKEAKELLVRALDLCREPDGPAVYETAILTDLQMIEDFCSADTFSGVNEKMQKPAWMRLPANRDKTVSEEKSGRVKLLREEVKELVGELSAQYFYQETGGYLSDLKLCRDYMEVLAGLVREFVASFEAEKRKKDMIDFSDMEQYALRILTKKEEGGLVPSAVAGEYQQQFKEIMIDEYQDSNLIQEAILTSISTVRKGRYNIFMVGDVKQSIYRFRLSRPELFMEKFDTYRTEDNEKQRIDLHKNFRSRGEVLDSINYIFRQIMTRGLGGIAYDDEAALYAGAGYPDAEKAGVNARTEVLVIDSNTENAASGGRDSNSGSPGGASEFPVLSERELEARAIAGRIRSLLKEHRVVDKETGTFRPVRYSDIVILTRSVKGFADVFAEVLNKEGIPASAGTREGYFETQEIGVLLDYLRVLDNWQQDIPLAAVLSSPFGGLNEEELAVIKSGYKELPFYEAVFCYRAEGQDEGIRKKLEKCLGELEAFRKKVPYTPVHELLRKILSDTGYGDFVSAMPGGAQRRANLDMLSEKAKAFESASYKGLFHFIRYIGQLRKYDVDYGEAALEDEQSDTVRIMTIHKSKGLEFPVVFAAGMGKRFNMQDARSSVVLHQSLGVGLDAVNLDARTKSPSLVKKVIQKEEALDSLGEELRVLYVALTRAKEKLILTGTVSNPEKKLEGFRMINEQEEEALSFGMLSKASTYWDWILPALTRLTPEVPIDYHVLTFEDLVREEVAEETAGRITKSVLENWNVERTYDEETRKMLKEQFGFSYAYENSRSQKLKFTVSELKKRAHLQEIMEDGASGESGELLYEEPEVIPLIPKFLKEEEELSGASRGTAYHRFLELLDFKEEYTKESLIKAVDAFSESGKMTEEMAACIRPADILGFLNSRSGKRMRECALRGTLRRERPFVMGIDAKEIYPQEEEGEMLLVQGIIDVYFEEPDGITVLDYKTDKVRRAEELAEKYHAQLDYYAKALERVTNKKVKEKIIYSFTLGEEISL